MQIVHLLEVLSNFGWLIIEHKCMINRVLLKVHIVYYIGPFISPISDDTLVDEL